MRARVDRKFRLLPQIFLTLSCEVIVIFIVSIILGCKNGATVLCGLPPFVAPIPVKAENVELKRRSSWDEPICINAHTVNRWS
jgi:hypothetical protein